MIKKLINYSKDLIAFCRYKIQKPKSNSKNVWVQFQNPQLYHRFFYLLLKYYHLSGYTVHYPMNFSTFRNLRNKDRYLALLLNESDFISINKKYIPKGAIIIRDENFSPDYFNNYFKQANQEKDCYHVPMTFHPYMYHNTIWDLPVNTNLARNNAIFCYGNFDTTAYKDIHNTYFNVIDRVSLLDFCQKQDNLISLKNKKETLELLNKNQLNGKLAFALKHIYSLQMEDIRPIVSKFNFYLCCPGVVMPLCHNIIEAMSVGTIPIIQREYADVVYPNLKHLENAIIFDDYNSLQMLLNEIIFNINPSDIIRLQNNVLDYYNKHLMPNAVINQVNYHVSMNHKIYLQAEHRSVKFKSNK